MNHRYNYKELWEKPDMKAHIFPQYVIWNYLLHCTNWLAKSPIFKISSTILLVI
jgi:hypothetical protein